MTSRYKVEGLRDLILSLSVRLSVLYLVIICRSVYPSTCLSMFYLVFLYLSVYLSIFSLFACLSIFFLVFICLSIYPSFRYIYLSIFIYPFICPSLTHLHVSLSYSCFYLSINLSFLLSTCLSIFIHPFICPSLTHLHVSLSYSCFYLSIYLSVFQVHVYLSLSIRLSAHQLICMFLYLV